MRNVKVYPSCCTSAFCGYGTCPKDCQNLPKLREFEEWVKTHNAVQADRIWTPNVYIARQ